VAQAAGLRAFGITSDGTLMAMFTTDRPQVLDWVRAVTGLSGDTKLIGIDIRVQNGTMYGVDFNPAADRLRVISDNGQNLRHNLADGTTIEDTTLTTPPATGPARGVTAAAYTNNDLNPDTATTLFDINTTTDQVVIQSPANNGTLAPTGALGVDAGPNAGLDGVRGAGPGGRPGDVVQRRPAHRRGHPGGRVPAGHHRHRPTTPGVRLIRDRRGPG
jgi:hypothetical protein